MWPDKPATNYFTTELSVDCFTELVSTLTPVESLELVVVDPDPHAVNTKIAPRATINAYFFISQM